MKTAIIYSLFVLTFFRTAVAHPVAQGSVDLQILPGNLILQARVAGEEIFVANTFGNHSSGSASTLPQVWQRHAQYLLDHFKILADGRALTGQIVNVAPAQNDFVLYRFAFPIAFRPRDLRIEEDVLREIEYAPGNPWEASYIARIREGDRLQQEGALLSARQPLMWQSQVEHPLSSQRGEGQGEGCSSAKRTESLHRGLFYQYLRHGITHILGGYDHLLFVIALVLAAATFWDLLKVVTAFTVAHTVTLALSVLNIVRLRSSIVEPMIAGSIVFVALTNVFFPHRSRGWTRTGTAFFFGLFHGLGFAGGLLSATDGMSGMPVLLAIAAFSFGVELGHQMIVLPLFSALKLIRATQPDDATRERFAAFAARGGSLLISVAGVVYLIAALRF